MSEKNEPPSEEKTTPLSDLGQHDAPTITPWGLRRGTSGRVVFEPDRVVAGRYRIIRFIARGGMGEVYEAEDLELHGRVALKTIRPEIADDATAIDRFRREIQMARKVTHRNVCRVFDVSHDQSDGHDVIFVTMELLTGQTLSQLIREGALTPEAALPIARQMADGLAAAHDAGVIHRDFKSANVMLVPEAGQKDARVVVTDFGLARASAGGERSVTNTGDIMGSPPYLAPEQIEGKELSPATDVYAFGVVLYEMVTGTYPFVADTPIASVLKRLHEPAVSPRQHVANLDPNWEHAILRCLERDPADRFPDTRSAVRALEGAQPAAIPSQRRARTRLVAIVLASTAIAAGIATLLPRKREEPIKLPSPQVTPARRAVAVIGFKNQSGQKDVGWLSTAFAEMVTTEIAAGEQVRTIPGESIARMKTDLAIGDTESVSADTLARIRKIIAPDYLVSGSYAAVGAPGARQLRLDIQLQEALGGNVIAAVAETGTEDRIFDLVSRAGARLREKLGVAAVTPEAASGILASLPSNPRAVRFYADGLAKVRIYDNIGARQALERAIAEDPDFPLAHAQLAGAHAALGYDARAKQEIQTAMKHAGKLPRENRLLIEAQAHSQNGDFAQAAEIYSGLSRFYPDNLDYAVRTVFATIYGGKGKDALVALDSLKKTWSGDPRLDVAEAEAAESISDYKRCRAAALRAVKVGDERGQRLLAARARLFEGWALLRMSDQAGARTAFEDAKLRYEKVGDRSGIGQALGGIGAVLYDTNKLDEALSIFEAERKIAHDTGSVSGEAADLHNIALVHNKKGDLAGAKSALRQALALERDSGNKGGLAGTLDALGGVEMNAGNLSEAAKLYEQALSINEEIGAAHGAANNRNNLAIIMKNKGDLQGAERLFDQAIAGYRKTNDEAAVADTLNNLAVVQRTRGNLAAAEKSYKEAEQVYTRLNSKTDLAMVAVNVATILTERGDLAGARQKNEQALAVWQSTGEKSYAAYALMGIGDIDFKNGDLARAEKVFRDALQIREQMGEKSTAGESMLALSDVLTEQGRLAEAEQMARSAAAIFEKEQRSDVLAMAKSTLCRIAIARRDLSAAAQFLREAQAHEVPDEYAISLTEAKLALASARPGVAVRQLTELVKETSRKGVVPMQMEARLALAEAKLAAGQSQQARSELESLEWDATKKGFGLVARKAAQLKQKAAA